MALSFVGAVANSTISGNSPVTTIPGSPVAGDKVIVFSVVTRTGSAQTVTSSSGAAYSQILAPTANGNAVISAWGRTLTTPVDTTYTCSGTGNAQDTVLTVGFVFRDSNGGGITATSNSTTGTSTTPNSPAVTSPSTGTVIFSAFGGVGADTTVTAPTSYLNAQSTAGTDTRSATIGGAWVAAGTSGSFDPTGWSNFTSAAWVAATVALSATPDFTWFAPVQPEMPSKYSKIDIVGY